MLAVTGIGQGTMFHVLSIILILVLTGVFCHQLISMLMLMRRPKRSRHATTRRGRRRPARRQVNRGPRDWTLTPPRSNDELAPDQPIRIHMATDGESGPDLETGEQPALRQPPPVYGNFRTSMVGAFQPFRSPCDTDVGWTENQS